MPQRLAYKRRNSSTASRGRAAMRCGEGCRMRPSSRSICQSRRAGAAATKQTDSAAGSAGQSDRGVIPQNAGWASEEFPCRNSFCWVRHACLRWL